MTHDLPSLEKIPTDFIDECRAIYSGKMNISSHDEMLSERSSKDPSNKTTTFRFIFWTHKAENQKNVLPLLRDCDILAIEDCRDMVFRTKEEMDTEVKSLNKLYDAVTEILSDTSSVSRQKLRLLQNNELFEPNIRDVLSYCTIDGPKVFKKIDVGPYEADTLVNSLDKIWLDREKEFAAAVDSPASSWNYLRESALGERSAATAAEVYREVIISQQLEQLGRDNPGMTISVLLGRAHHTVTLRLDKNKWNIERFFIKDETVESAPEHRVGWVHNSLVSADALRAGLNPTYEIDQIILHEIVSHYGEQSMLSALSNLNAEQNHHLLERLQRVWGERLSSEEKIQIRAQTTLKTLKVLL
jgi:hypothetical protein